jgi:oligoribonuclease NrnB/cAMP/cGMP phosphodiesterase (DHH superfamily)
MLLAIYVERTFGVTPEVYFTDYDHVCDVVEQASVDSSHLWISDLSIRDLELAAILSSYTPDTLHFFDHHPDSQIFVDAISSFATINFVSDGTKCAADLIYDFIEPTLFDGCSYDADLPDEENTQLKAELFHLKNATRSRDLWINDVQEGTDLSAVIAMLGAEKSYHHFMEQFNRIHKENFSDLMNFCIRIANESVEKAKTLAQFSKLTETLHGITVVAAFTIGCQSEVGDMFLQENPLTLVGLINVEKQNLSFRTTKEAIAKLGFGVNDIAKTFDGGGGHPYAAGALLTPEMLTMGTALLCDDMISFVDTHAKEKGN